MRGKKKWLVFSLVVLCGLALSVTLFSGGQGDPVPRGAKCRRDCRCSAPSTTTSACRSSARSTVRSWSRSGNPRPPKNRLGSGSCAEDPGQRGAARRSTSPSSADGQRTGHIIDPVIQAALGQPVLRRGQGMITASSDPRSLESQLPEDPQVLETGRQLEGVLRIRHQQGRGDRRRRLASATCLSSRPPSSTTTWAAPRPAPRACAWASRATGTATRASPARA